ncbi:MAG: type II toxin-antitoxin system VapC family toxin [Pseudolabrys sp.]
MQPLLWDTCAVIWIAQGERLAQSALDLLAAAQRDGVTSYVSPMTAWEIGMLNARGRIQLLIKPERWFANVAALPGVRLAELSPDVLIASSYLPGKPPSDPTDRIIAATARELGATLLTRDRALLGYGAQGHVNVVQC